MKFLKDKNNRCFYMNEKGDRIELKVVYSHDKPCASIKNICEDRQFLSLSKITECDVWVDIELTPHVSRSVGMLTETEKERIAQLEAEIKAIKDAAKLRQPKKYDTMTKEEKIEFLKSQLEKLEG